MRWHLLLQEIRRKKLDLARLDPRAGMPVMPPPGASPAAIDTVERRLGRPLPRSYRALLAHHDGVPQLYHGASLLGVRPLSRGTYVDLARLSIDTPEGAAGHLCPFGIDAQGEAIFAWDRSAPDHDGELPVVVWINEIGTRVESFPEFLELICDMISAEIDDRRRASPRAGRRPAPSSLQLAFA